MFAVQDLFAVGLALDIAGALLLARAVLLTASQISRVSGTYWNSNAHDAVSRAEDKVDARFGVIGLICGFSLQLTGYVIEVAANPKPATGTSAAFSALVLGGIAAGILLISWRSLRPSMTLKILPEIALAHPGSGREGDEQRSGWTRYRAARLINLGQAAGYPFVPEDDADNTKVRYVHRVFGIELPEDQI